jgi:hypothetical protein
MGLYKNLNFLVLKFFAPILILTGILGYVIPEEYSLMSNENYYNLFHINAGLIGMIILFTMNLTLIRGFNIAFGMIDLYQVFASYFGFFPEEVFKYTLTDNILHVDIGIALIFIGIIAKKTVDYKEEYSQTA